MILVINYEGAKSEWRVADFVFRPKEPLAGGGCKRRLVTFAGFEIQKAFLQVYGIPKVFRLARKDAKASLQMWERKQGVRNSNLDTTSVFKV